MAKFLFQVSYTAEGMRGVLKEGGTSRRSFIEQLLKENGGNVEAFYYAFGNEDVFVIADIPDNVTAAAIGLTVGASGVANIHTTVLLSPEEIDDATQKTIAYRAPGA